MTVSTVTPLRLLLPLVPPSLNTIWRRGNGRTYLNQKYEKWIADTSHFISQQTARQTLKPMYRAPVAVHVQMRRPRANSDLDNRLKALGDILQRYGVLEDDKLIVEWWARWSDDIQDGFEVVVNVIPQGAVAGEGLG